MQKTEPKLSGDHASQLYQSTDFVFHCTHYICKINHTSMYV